MKDFSDSVLTYTLHEMIIHDAGVSAKTIDKFAESLIKRCWSKMGELGYVSEEEIKEIAEQLKGKIYEEYR